MSHRRRLFFILALWTAAVRFSGGQAPLPPAITVEETRTPVFAGFRPADDESTLEHPEPLANFRLRFAYRLPAPGSALAVRLHPRRTLDLPAASAGSWQTVDLQYEQLPGRAASFSATIDDRPFVEDETIPEAEGHEAAPARATFPQGIPGVPTTLALLARGGAEIRDAWAQPLAEVDHASLIARWGREMLAEGQTIYQTLCVTCHGTLTQEGSLPTSRQLHREPFKNGSDPFRMFQTLTQGYGLMPPMPPFSAAQRYAVIHYVRETLLRPANPGELFPVDDAYLAALPRGMRTGRPADAAEDRTPPYERMNFGPVLNATYQVDAGTPAARANFAYKGLAVRLDPGEGGVSQGRAWLVHDHDTLRVAAAVTGSFVDWKGVAFDGSHGTHLSLTGRRWLTNPPGPGWAEPKTGSWEDPRFHGRDGRPYGPLPRDWARYEGMCFHGPHVVLRYTVGDAHVLDAAEPTAESPTALLRTLNIGRSRHDLSLRLAPETDALEARVLGSDAARVENEGGFQVLRLPAAATPLKLRLWIASAESRPIESNPSITPTLPLDLSSLTHGGPPRWPHPVATQGANAPDDDGPFAADVITHPEGAANPWHSWMRLTGFDFFADGERAAVCTWMGDVWIVEGLARQPLGELTWRRIATGLFQPLGLKILHDTIHVCCRDQIARLHDLNGDGEIDFVECLNNDHQVTEHFHEFAMGLQADAAGNFYYAKSARHALPAVVPHHGTLLRVSADGSRTDILATGFRAANGVCLNPDGTFFVTDQEGHWMPKNRINLVRGEGPSEFFGNLFGYTDVTDPSDNAMRQPLAWITNAFDRSPSELLWVPPDAQWGPLNGSLLNLSYGYGRIYTVPFATVNGQPQGGLCALPLPAFPTGVMRGRFHPRDGQLYACGMFAWAGNQTQPGGFYRVRFTGRPALQPIALHFEKGAVRLGFSDPLDPATATVAVRYAVKAWDLGRSANYGSPHVNEHALPVTRAELLDDKTLRLHLPGLHPTRGLEIHCRLRFPDGRETERVVHGTIHAL